MILYKYVPAERVDVLHYACIRYTQPGALNDPFEACPHVAAVAPHDEAVSILRELAPSEIACLYASLSDGVRSAVSLAQYEQLMLNCLHASVDVIARHMNAFAGLVRRRMPSVIDGLMGILALTEDRESLLMWSHYAGGHTGFVVGFDATHTHFDERRAPMDEMRHLRRVEYRQERPSGPLTGFGGIDMFLVKSVHWSYEREWRIMRALQDASRTVDLGAGVLPVHLFQFPPKAVSEVILGARMESSVRLEILELLRADRYAHVRVFDSVPHESLFVISLREVADM